MTRGTVDAEVGIGTIVTGSGRDRGLDLAYVNFGCFWMKKTLTRGLENICSPCQT